VEVSDGDITNILYVSGLFENLNERQKSIARHYRVIMKNSARLFSMVYKSLFSSFDLH